MSNQPKKVRYQVLFNGKDHGTATVNFGPREAAQAKKFLDEQKALGKDCSLWDSLDNPLSRMFKL